MRAPAFQIYPAEELARRLGLSLVAGGATSTLEFCMWSQSEDQCSLPDDDKMLARILGVSVEEWMVLREEILHAGRNLFVQRNGRLVSLRLKDEAAKQRKYRKSQSEKGRLSAQRRLNRGSTAAQPEQQPEGNSSTPIPNSSSLQNSQKNSSESVTPEQLAVKWNALGGVKPITFNGKLHPTIRKTCCARIQEHPTMEWWEEFFIRIAQAPWLTGQVPGKDGQSSFVATFDWVMGPTNMGKILSGTYDKHGTKATTPLIPPQKKCTGMNGEPCQDYVAPPSKTFCPKHKAANDDRLAKMTGPVQAHDEIMEAHA